MTLELLQKINVIFTKYLLKLASVSHIYKMVNQIPIMGQSTILKWLLLKNATAYVYFLALNKVYI